MSLIFFNFHGVGPVTRDIGPGELDCWLDQERFEVVLDLVRDQPHVRLTVDDGNASDVEYILPSLLRRGLTATFFICSDLVDRPTFLSQTQVRELQDKGMVIGSHGAIHRPWRHLTPAQRSDEFAGSRAALEAICDRPVDTAACPFGIYDHAVLRGLREVGYRAVYTSDCGATKESQWLRARTTIKRSTPLSYVENLIKFGPSVWSQTMISTRTFLKRLR